MNPDRKQTATMPWWWTGAGDFPPLRTPALRPTEKEKRYIPEKGGSHA